MQSYSNVYYFDDNVQTITHLNTTTATNSTTKK